MDRSVNLLANLLVALVALPGGGRGGRGRKAPAFRPGMKSPLSHPSCGSLLLFDVLLDDGDGSTAT